MHTVSPSFLEKNGSVHGAFGEDLGIISVNLSSTLRKLCLWEKKLYDEVKVCFTLFQEEFEGIFFCFLFGMLPGLLGKKGSCLANKRLKTETQLISVLLKKLVLLF